MNPIFKPGDKMSKFKVGDFVKINMYAFQNTICQVIGISDPNSIELIFIEDTIFPTRHLISDTINENFDRKGISPMNIWRFRENQLTLLPKYKHDKDFKKKMSNL